MISIFALAAALPAFDVQVTDRPKIYVPPPPPITFDQFPTASYPSISGLGRLALSNELPTEFTKTAPFTASFELLVDTAGKVTACTPKWVFPRGTLANNVCAHIVAVARYTMVPTVAIPGGYGIVHISGEVGAIAPIAMPVTFLPKDRGLPVSISYSLSDPAHPNCFPWTESGVLPEKTRVAICAALNNTSAVRQRRGTNGIQFGTNGQDTSIKVWLTKKLGPPPSAILWTEFSGTSPFEKFVYPTQEPQLPELDRAAGTLRAALTEADYPDVAADLKLEGLSVVQVVVAPNGTLERCDPVESSAGIFLDTQACTVLMKTGKFVFAEGVKPDGPKAYRTRMRWRYSDYGDSLLISSP